MRPRATYRRPSTRRAASFPANLPANPYWRKVNPADAPILMLGLTSTPCSPGPVYDVASTILQQKISQVQGVGQVFVGGSALPGGARRSESVAS